MIINKLASDVLISLFDFFNKSDVKYAVLRNYEKLPEESDSKDVDILIDPEQFGIAYKLLIEVGRSNNYKLIWENKLDYLYGLSFVKIDNNIIYSIKIDLFNGLLWRGSAYLDCDYLFNKSNRFNGFKVLNKSHESFLMIVYYLLYAKKIKDKYVDIIYTNALTDFNEFEFIVNKTLSEDLSEQIISQVKEKQIKDLEFYRSQIRNEVILNNKLSCNYIKNVLLHLKKEYYERNKWGSLLVFSGPDGAGKSSIITTVLNLFNDLGISQNKIPHHFLTDKIPSLHSLPGAPRKYANQDYTKPYESKPAGTISSIIRSLYYFSVFLYDRLFIIKKELKGNNIVFFDRYYTDMIVDPSRMRISLSKKLVQSLFSFLPKPSYTFIIIAEMELILSRKDELEEDKLVELLSEYKKLSLKIPNSQIINNSLSLHKGQLDLCNAVFKSLEII
jgi:thymidylate kinase